MIVVRSVPPHPGPLPRGEGALYLAFDPKHSSCEHVLPSFLPLPKGEGRGEGDQNARKTTLAGLTQGVGAMAPHFRVGFHSTLNPRLSTTFYEHVTTGN